MKLSRRHDIPQFTDIVGALKDGVVLVALLEELSETKFPEKNAPKPTTQRIKQIEGCNAALKWCWNLGIDLRNKPQSEDFVDARENPILGLIWALMMKFMKIGDDEDSQKLNARDALLMWVNSKCPEFGGIENFKKTAKSPFHNGMALCALIHKHRPKLIPEYPTLDPSHAIKNIELAQEAAFKYFQLEKFLTATDVTKLDENSMFIYVSEFYYGVAEQKKLDLAARRLTKLIKLTKENDKLKEEYNETAATYKKSLLVVEDMLHDVTIDNTMAGAKKRLDDFYKIYKQDQKNVLLGSQLNLERLYNSLAMRLAHHKRPEFIPPEGVTLADVQKAIHHLELVEVERSQALHAELNRQIKLLKMDEQHQTVVDNLNKWVAEKEAYLKTKEVIDSVSAAQFHLRLLEAFDKEREAAIATNVAALKNIGKDLDANKYENHASVVAREAEVDKAFAHLAELSALKLPVLKDDLERELYKQNTRLMFQEHTEKNEAILKWIAASREYLNTREKVYSVTEAHTQLSLLESFEQEKITVNDANVEEMKQLGRTIAARKHDTEYSQWVFENPEELTKRAEHIDAEWEALRLLSEEKKNVLKDHLTREEVREKFRIANQQHIDQHALISEWIAEKEKYLQTWPKIESLTDVIIQLSLLSAYDQEYDTMLSTQCAALKALGDSIRAAVHDTKYSKYTYEHTKTYEPVFEASDPAAREAIAAREDQIRAKFADLKTLEAKFKEILDDHKKREDFAMEMRTRAQTLNYVFNKLMAWGKSKSAFLNAREEITSVSGAQTHLTFLEQYVSERESVNKTTLAAFKALAKEILTKTYSSPLSSYVYEHTKYDLPAYDHEEADKPQAINASTAEIDKLLAQLAEEEAERKRVLDDHLQRETFARDVRLLDEQHKKQLSKIEDWVNAKTEYLKARPTVNSVSDAQTQLSIFDSYEKDVATTTSTSIAKLKEFGAKICPMNWKGKYSSFKCENPDEILARHAKVDSHLVALAELASALKADLEALLEREKEREKMRLEYAHLALEFSKWVSETCKTMAIEHFGFTLEEVTESGVKLDDSEASLLASADKSIAQITAVKNAMDAAGVTENIYSKLSLGDIDKLKQDLIAGFGVRRAAHKAELDKQIANDNLCKEFAGVVEPFSKFIQTQKETITSSKSELEVQLEFVNKQIANVATDAARLEPVREVAARMDKAKITFIRHTTLTLKDVEVQWEQYKKFLDTKKDMLLHEIENAKLKGITPEQFREIENNFKIFDKDGNGKIDRKELTACLYSLGEEKTSKEITAILTEFGDVNHGISYEGFKNFMIRILGDSDTKDEILSSLSLINRHNKEAIHAQMEIVVPQADLDYFEATAPKAGANWDFVAWVEAMYSR